MGKDPMEEAIQRHCWDWWGAAEGVMVVGVGVVAEVLVDMEEEVRRGVVLASPVVRGEEEEDGGRITPMKW